MLVILLVNGLNNSFHALLTQTLMIPSRDKVGSILFVLLFCITVAAQRPRPSPSPSPDDDVIRITTNVVQVDAIVTDRKGKVVTDLAAEDFEIVDDGKVLKPEYFLFIPLVEQVVEQGESGVTGEPAPVTIEQIKRTFVFLVDNPLIDIGCSQSSSTGVSSGTVSFRARATRAGEEAEKLLMWFVDTQMEQRDLVAIADIELNIGKLSSFTTDRELLRKAISYIRANATSGEKQVIRITSVNGEAGLQPLIKQNLAVIKTLSHVIDRLKTLPGRKVVSLISRGMMFDSRLPGTDVVRDRLEELIAKANRERVTIYTMSPTGLGNVGGVSMVGSSNVPGRLSNVGLAQGLQDIDSLQHIAKETGARAIYGTNDMRVGFAQVLEENRGYYLLGFNPGPEAAGRPHRLKVNVKRPGLKVQARATAYSQAK